MNKNERFDVLDSPCQVREAMLNQYIDVFQPLVWKLREDLQNYPASDDHPAFLGCGGESEVFYVLHDGKKHAVRLPWQEVEEVVEKHIAGAVLGRGVPGLEQMVAASPEDGVTVSEMMPGKVMFNRTVNDMQAVSDKHIAGFIDTVTLMEELGIAPDPHSSNVFYDPDVGFGIIDYDAKDALGGYYTTMEEGETVGYAVATLMGIGEYELRNRQELAVIGRIDMLEWDLANINLFKRMRATVSQKLSGEERSNALGIIDASLLAYDAKILYELDNKSRVFV